MLQQLSYLSAMLGMADIEMKRNQISVQLGALDNNLDIDKCSLNMGNADATWCMTKSISNLC